MIRNQLIAMAAIALLTGNADARPIYFDCKAYDIKIDGKFFFRQSGVVWSEAVTLPPHKGDDPNEVIRAGDTVVEIDADLDGDADCKTSAEFQFDVVYRRLTVHVQPTKATDGSPCPKRPRDLVHQCERVFPPPWR